MNSPEKYPTIEMAKGGLERFASEYRNTTSAEMESNPEKTRADLEVALALLGVVKGAPGTEMLVEEVEKLINLTGLTSGPNQFSTGNSQSDRAQIAAEKHRDDEDDER